ncbi:MAG: glutathione peroxidase [Paracoccaceae bacterium]
MRRRVFLGRALAGMGLGVTAPAVLAATAARSGFSFASIDGGLIRLDDWRGHPVLVVNTASLCGFAGQFDDLQALHDRYAARGLLVLAVPSDDFNQELADAQAVKEYCALRFDLTLAMTDITHVRGPKAHPFYQWLAAEHGFTPGWNFNKVLIGPEGEVLGTWGSAVKPTAGAIIRRIEPLLR